MYSLINIKHCHLKQDVSGDSGSNKSFYVTRLVLEGDRLPESDEGGVDCVDPAPLPRVPLLHHVDRLVRGRNVLVPRPLPSALVGNFWINLQ